MGQARSLHFELALSPMATSTPHHFGRPISPQPSFMSPGSRVSGVRHAGDPDHHRRLRQRSQGLGARLRTFENQKSS